MLDILAAGRARRAPARRPGRRASASPYFTHRVAIELGLLWILRADDDGAALPVLHYPVATAALAALPRHGIDELRAEETELIDHAVNSLIGIATDNTTSARTRVEAWSAIRGWAECKARLLGLDAPKTQAVLTLDAIDAQIAALEAELGVRAALEEGPGMDD